MREALPPPRDGDDQALDWFLRLQDPALPPARRRDFLAWRNADPANGAAYDRVAGLWAAPEFAAAVARQAPPPTAPALTTRPRPRWIAAAGALAASLLLLVGAAQVGGLLTNWRADYVTAIGEREVVTLADGSQVTLNSGSAVELAFDDGRRGLRLLRGEAFFDVVPDPARPFEVESGHARVRVVGTAFAVRDGDEQDQVTVLRGEVAVSGSAGQGEVRLLPGQTVLVGGGGPTASPSAVEGGELAWVEGRFRFSERPLGEVIGELRRYHPGLILLKDETLAAIRITGDFRLDDTAAIAASLAAAVGARLTTLGGGVLLIEPTIKAGG